MTPSPPAPKLTKEEAIDELREAEKKVLAINRESPYHSILARLAHVRAFLESSPTTAETEATTEDEGTLFHGKNNAQPDSAKTSGPLAERKDDGLRLVPSLEYLLKLAEEKPSKTILIDKSDIKRLIELAKAVREDESK